MAQYLDAHRRLALLKREVDRVMEEVDLVVSPTCLTPPLRIAETKGVTIIRGRRVEASPLTLKATALASDTGRPAISLPCGFANGSLPIGLHIMGRHLEESLVLRAAHVYEQATEWHLRHPAVG
jgi:aspartyl-tRNA(Asn)/glutamyl-tRNA(Gln) amidotransferase subunit A